MWGLQLQEQFCVTRHANRADGVCGEAGWKAAPLQRKALLSLLKYRVVYGSSVDFIFIVKVMIMDHINLYGVVASSVKLHSLLR